MSARVAKRPCANCHWRVGVVGARDIPGWGPELTANLARTCRDDGLKVMACHKAEPGREIPCVGYVVQVGYDGSVGLRLLASLTRKDIAAECEPGPDPLHPDFEAMLTASGVPVPPRNRYVSDDEEPDDD